MRFNETNSLTNPDAEFWQMGKRTFETPRHKPIITFLIGSFKRLAIFMRTKVIRDDVSAFFMNIVHETVQHRIANRIRRNDFMDILINLTNQSEGSLTIDEIAAQSVNFSVGTVGNFIYVLISLKFVRLLPCRL